MRLMLGMCATETSTGRGTFCPEPSPQILRLVTMSLYCIFFKSLHPAAGCLWALHSNASQSPNLRRIGRGSRFPVPFVSIVLFILLVRCL
ncbi:hypothetical protein V1527DRAFT_476214 [Lipomyces starkeyi]